MKESLRTGSIIAHYRIMHPVGAGGMGEVYLAEDLTLGRRVALKILPAQATGEEDRLRRFEQEARAASALNHPNIITIHEVGIDKGAHFIATEFIEGETLRSYLRRMRPSLQETIEITMQVASALSAAHQVGIIHRDIKPENIMVRPDGYVKVLDFGVVKLTETFISRQTGPGGETGADEVELINTESNIVMGSPNYMSPEQARGLGVDARTDIFSLGVVMYEMLTGHRPFDGETISDVIVAILERAPAPLVNFMPDVSPRLERIINKALSKNRTARYETAAEMLKDLKRQKQRLMLEAGLDDSMSPDFEPQPTVEITAKESGNITVRETSPPADQVESSRPVSSAEYLITEIKHHKAAVMVIIAVALSAVVLLILLRGDGRVASERAGGPAIGSIAVLPFINMSDDPENEYLSDGITETLINDLSRMPDLKVMSRNAAFRYKGQDVDAAKVGRDLGVRAVLAGTIRQRGDGLTVGVELIDAGDNSRIWGEQYNRRMPDILALQQEIATSIVAKLQPKLGGEGGARVGRQYTASPQAYQHYMRGRYYWNKRTEEGLKRGIDYFKQAIDADPAYALAYAGLADCYALLADYGGELPGELYPRVRAAATEALRLDDSLAEAHTSLGAVYEYEWNWVEAERQYGRAIALNSNYPTAHHWYGLVLAARNRAGEAVEQIKRALELDPLSLIINTALGRAYYCAREYDLAIEQLGKTLEMDPNFAEARFHLGLAYEQKGMHADAIKELQRAAELFGDETLAGWTGRVYAAAGNRAEAERVLKRLEKMPKRTNALPYIVATTYAALGNKEKTFEWLDLALKERSIYVTGLNTDPVFDSLRSDARFSNLLRQIGFE